MYSTCVFGSWKDKYISGHRRHWEIWVFIIWIAYIYIYWWTVKAVCIAFTLDMFSSNPFMLFLRLLSLNSCHRTIEWWLRCTSLNNGLIYLNQFEFVHYMQSVLQPMDSWQISPPDTFPADFSLSDLNVVPFYPYLTNRTDPDILALFLINGENSTNISHTYSVSVSIMSSMTLVCLKTTRFTLEASKLGLFSLPKLLRLL